MLNAGLEHLQPRDWVLFHDADVLLSPQWGEWIRSRVLNPGVLYWARRVHALDEVQWKDAMRDWSTSTRLRVRDPAADLMPFGFHQLWNVRAASIAGRRPIVSDVFPTAATVDYHFLRLWPEDKRARLPDEMSIVHHWHGPFASRWHNPRGLLWFMDGKEPRWPATVKLIDLDAELAEVVTLETRRQLDKTIGRRVVDVYARSHNHQEAP
jgi:hypothetical protein